MTPGAAQRQEGPTDIRVEIVVRDGRDFFTDTREDIARITYALSGRRYVLLACREDGDWFPTWLGEEGRDTVPLPRGFQMPPEITAAFPEEAPR